MSKSEFLYAVVPIVGLFGLLIGVMLYLPNQYIDVFPQAEMFDADGGVVKVEGLLTAEQLCRQQVSVRYGDRLLSTTLDGHSSRFDVPRDLFLVLMQVSVGDYTRSEDFKIHCHVQLGASQVAYLGAFDMAKPWERDDNNSR